MAEEFEVPDKLAASLAEYPRMEEDLRELWLSVLNAYGGKWYPIDMYLQGAVKRTLSQSHAIRLLLESGNLMSARSLLRLQLDTAMRVHAAWLAPDPHGFVLQVLDGKKVGSLKDRDGEQLRDWYLVKKMNEKYGWFKAVYDRTSSYVHLSMSQFLVSVTQAEGDGRLSMEVGWHDAHMPVQSFVEVSDCFKAATEIVFEYLNGWLVTKSNPEEVRKLREKLEEDEGE